MRWILRGWWVLILHVCYSATAFADSPRPRVLVVSEQTSAEIVTNLVAELVNAGYEPLSEQAPSGDDSQRLEQRSRAAGSVAVLVVEGVRSVQVWTRERGTGELMLRASVRTRGAMKSDNTLVLRATEVLRANLLSVEERPHPDEAIGEPPGPGRSPVERSEPAGRFKPRVERRRIVAQVPVVVFSPGGLGPNLSGQLGGSWLLTDRLAANIDVVAQLIPSHLEGAEGTSDVVVGVASAGASWFVAPHHGRWNADLGLGIGLAWLRAGATATTGYQSRTDTAIATFPHARVRGRRRLTDSVWLVLDTRIGFAAPSLAIRFAERRVATWGRPAVMTGLGFELGL